MKYIPTTGEADPYGMNDAVDPRYKKMFASAPDPYTPQMPPYQPQPMPAAQFPGTPSMASDPMMSVQPWGGQKDPTGGVKSPVAPGADDGFISGEGSNPGYGGSAMPVKQSLGDMVKGGIKGYGKEMWGNIKAMGA